MKSRPSPRRAAFALTAFLALTASGFGQTVYTTADTPYPLDDLGHSPRAFALGGAFGAVSGDASCLFYNPAGLAGLSATQISAVHESWVADISQETLLAGWPAGKAGAFALAANYLGFGTLQGYDASGNPASPLHPFRGSLSLGWGVPFAPGISAGLAVHGDIQSLVPGASDLSGFLRAGALWRPFPDLALGAAYSFLETDRSPGTGFLRLGAAWSRPLLFKDPLLLQTDFTLPLYNVARLQLGLEQPFLSVLVARLGYQWEIDNNHIAGFRGMTCGVGFDLGEWGLDYSYVPDGDLGASQAFSLTYRFSMDSTPTGSGPGELHPATQRPPNGSPTPKPFAPSPTPTATFVTTPSPSPAATAIPSTSPTVHPVLPSNAEPSPASIPNAKPPLRFNPSSTALPSDRVMKVKARFQIPDSVDSPGPASATPSPALQAALDKAGRKVQLHPNDLRAWLELGHLYWRSGQPDFAVQAFTEALRLDPANLPLKQWLEDYRKAHP